MEGKKKNTTEKKIEELKKQIAELEARSEIEKEKDDIIQSFIETLEGRLPGLHTESYVSGYCEEQKTNSNGELLYTVNGRWKCFTKAELDALGLDVTSDGVSAAHDAIWGERELTEDELDGWRHAQIVAINEVLEVLRSI